MIGFIFTLIVAICGLVMCGIILLMADDYDD